MMSELRLNIDSQAEKEKTNVELDDELDDDLNNFGNVFEVLQTSDKECLMSRVEKYKYE